MRPVVQVIALYDIQISPNFPHQFEQIYIYINIQTTSIKMITLKQLAGDVITTWDMSIMDDASVSPIILI